VVSVFKLDQRHGAVAPPLRTVNIAPRATVAAAAPRKLARHHDRQRDQDGKEIRR